MTRYELVSWAMAFARVRCSNWRLGRPTVIEDTAVCDPGRATTRQTQANYLPVEVFAEFEQMLGDSAMRPPLVEMPAPTTRCLNASRLPFGRADLLPSTFANRYG